MILYRKGLDPNTAREVLRVKKRVLGFGSFSHCLVVGLQIMYPGTLGLALLFKQRRRPCLAAASIQNLL